MREHPQGALEEGSVVVGGDVDVIPFSGRRYDRLPTSIPSVYMTFGQGRILFFQGNSKRTVNGQQKPQSRLDGSSEPT